MKKRKVTGGIKWVGGLGMPNPWFEMDREEAQIILDNLDHIIDCDRDSIKDFPAAAVGFRRNVKVLTGLRKRLRWFLKGKK